MASVLRHDDDRSSKRAGLGVALSLSFALCLSAFLLGLLISATDARQLYEALRLLQPAWIGLALAGLAALHAAGAERWALLQRGAGLNVRFRDAAVPLVGALALNNLLPLRAGDAVRVMSLESFAGRSRAEDVQLLAVESGADLAGSLAILAASLAVWPLPEAPAGQIFPPLALAATLAAVLVCAAVSACRAAAALRPLRSEPRRRAAARALAVAASTLAGRLGLVLVFFGAALALGLPQAWPAAVLAAGLVGLAAALPTLPGQLGPFDFFAAVAASAFGARPGAAIAFALLSHAVAWLPTTAAGWALLMGAGRLGLARPGPPAGVT